ncbi:MAG: alpha/beta hydrolase [Anaerolineaceae bacterium]|nr:MAG: alpha/beta hydrolase [Anaerolineaceae bacterium]
MQSHFIATNGIKLHVQTDGPENGTSVVLLHGFPEFWYGWRRQIPALVEAGFRVIVPDQRGYNLSDKPRSVAAYDVDVLARDVIGLLDHFGIQKARLVGHDWGAVVAWTVALQHPDRLEKLAILNVPHPDVMTRFVLGNSAQQKKSWYVFLFQLPFVEWVLSRNNFCNLERVIAGRKGSFTPEDILEYKKAWSQPRALTSMLNWYRAIVRRALRGSWNPNKVTPRRVHVPTLMLWGKRDVALSHEMAQPSIELCERGELVTFERATHWVQHDAADEVNQKLIAFLG